MVLFLGCSMQETQGCFFFFQVTGSMELFDCLPSSRDFSNNGVLVTIDFVQVLLSGSGSCSCLWCC